MKLKNMNSKQSNTELPLVPLRELVIFPHMIVPFFVGRAGSIKAVEAAMEADRMIMLTAQTRNTENPEPEDLAEAGTVCKILQMLKLPDGTIRVLAEGKKRATLSSVRLENEYFHSSFEEIEEKKSTEPAEAALMNNIQDGFSNYAKTRKKIPAEVKKNIEKAEYPDKLVDLVAAAVSFSHENKIVLLGMDNPHHRLEELAIMLEGEIEIQNLQNKIKNRVKERMEQTQKEYYLNEQIRQINKELGKDEDDPSGVKELEQKILSKELPLEVKTKAEKELKRLSKLQPMSPESGVLRTYLEWIADLPWDKSTEDNKDIDLAEEILDQDHYNMKKPKERILDFIAVRQLKEKQRGPILCFAGPPGTGKTSLGKSVARALNREFVRISLGGVRDEAEIRGHRKTYVGALPGKIIQAMKKTASLNPVFLLDEIDKLNSDFRGDPASALLEVLDPEQNGTFVDHYLEVPFDLSSVMFITTANSVHQIPHALRDRMEIIEIPGYSDLEKQHIAREFIIPKQLELNGFSGNADISFQPKALQKLISGYTMESGVRSLERQIATAIRKIAREAIREGYDPKSEELYKKQVSPQMIKKFLGNEQVSRDLVYSESRPGCAHGLAWTEVGGTLMPVEVSVIDGNGELILTGSLGDVMKESARIALSWIRTNEAKFGLAPNFHKEKDIHIHVPEGAIPKDGPSAGITLTSALLSALIQMPLVEGIAMTGEITLTGQVLPIGGVKEKVLAAYRNKLTKVMLPERNKRDLDELPKEVKTALEFHHPKTILEAFSVLFPKLEIEKSEEE